MQARDDFLARITTFFEANMAGEIVVKYLWHEFPDSCRLDASDATGNLLALLQA